MAEKRKAMGRQPHGLKKSCTAILPPRQPDAKAHLGQGGGHV
jgi:hypothetical protein